ncbi:Peptidase inhibitor family I36 [Micromonospora phaseoli]|uniref:Peptidase inhibitor family I36 n=1 Tax=Micromonospora phaseoli TaxID=1144548 RepID=A0A1H7DQS2_9ACTN|nr:peptidase inhibitor family I36 protein [Micromonospora phaseoli]PZV89985.1 peptidase inhibitor family I36 [Micromonospora phaseoli]GIJ78800.1 hypothetical protein Xph01_32320 [Micromonospora phaseoli]SEK04106.1 Peptidase inhibitor family I36 [Micromonospora phaseoli]
MKIGTRTAYRLAGTALCAGISALLLSVTASGVNAAAPAPALEINNTCSFSRTLCLWDSANFTGQRFTVQAIDPSVGACVNLAASGWGSGRAKSARNTASQPARLYTTTDCTGTPYAIMPGGAYGSISFNSNSVFVH